MQDVSVASRHKLKKHCTEQYQATLDIFDGQGIADMLADRDTAWIAEQYLEIPADAWPVSLVNDKYNPLARDRWLTNNTTPHNYADFLTIKQGSRPATFHGEAKPDISQWIKAMRHFLNDSAPDRLKQRARYEIAVAELRGKGSLDPALLLVADFFDQLSANRRLRNSSMPLCSPSIAGAPQHVARDRCPKRRQLKPGSSNSTAY